jgi:hypothetical protein
MNKKKHLLLLRASAKAPRAYTPPFTLHKANNFLMIYLHDFFPPNIRTCAKLVQEWWALRCVFLLAETVRNANDEGSTWKSTAK